MKKTLQYFAKNVLVVLGIVLIWRGVWYVLDEIDKFLFQGSHFWTSVIGIVVGLLILYLPDKNLKELGKL